MNITLLIILVVLNIPLYIFLGWVFFDNWGNFLQLLKFWFTPDIISAFKGEYWEDIWAEWKLGAFILICGAVVYGEYFLIIKIFY